MKSWWKITLLLCIFGFLKQLRPSEPFIYEFLIGPWRNLTQEQITSDVYPVGTYSNMILLIIVFLIVDICRYRPLIIVSAICGVIIWSMLLWTFSLIALQIVEVFYGMFMATEVAYYTYIYAKVDKEYYQKVTSHTRAAILAGNAISGILSQALISLNWMDFRQLNYITLIALLLAFIWSLMLPPVKTTIYFHSKEIENLPLIKKASAALDLMKDHFYTAYSNFYVFKWSIWWALSTCGYIQIEYYMQPLYEQIQESNEVAYNGAVSAILTLLGFCAVLLAGFLKVNWQIKGEFTLSIISLLQGIFIVTLSQTQHIFVCYILYILFGICYHFMITIASAQIAQFIDQDSYGLVFGINTFVSLIFNSILTALVVTKDVGFKLDPRNQYIVYGTYHLVISFIFIVTGIRTLWLNRK